MEKRPGDRYPTAAAFADDLARYLAGQPVAARPVGALIRGARWADRRRALILGIGGAVAAGLLIGLWSAGRAPVAAPISVPTQFQDGVHPGPSYQGTRDANLLIGAPDKNDGRGEHLSMGGDRSDRGAREVVIAWDLSAIPPATRIDAVTLQFYVVNGSGKDYQIYSLKRAWAETEITWNAWTPGKPWEAPGARGGLDRNMVSLGKVTGGPGFVSIPLNAAGVAAVQSWIRDPESNHGFLIMGPESTDVLQVQSRNSSMPERRPRLQIVPAK
jgi:hypothetical protein